MDYSILAQGLERDGDGVVFSVNSLYARFLRVADRRGRQGRRYELAMILTAVVLAKMGGEDTPLGIAEWVRARGELFIETFELKRRSLPGHNTYRRVLKHGLQLADLEREVRAYLATWPEVGTAVQLTLDGKTARGTIGFGETRGLHLLAAYVPGAGVVLAQLDVGREENEIVVAPQLLQMLDLQGKIVTGDALFAQRALSSQIVQAGGDYVWTIKDNQSLLKQEIEQLFDNDQGCVPGFSPAPTDFVTTQTVNNGHGRVEVRRLTTSGLLADTCRWPGAQQVFKLERHTWLQPGNRQRGEVVYGITSLSAAHAGPARLLAIIRTHWQHENCLHYRRDVTLREDAGRTGDWTVAQALASLNNLVLALLLRGHQSNLARERRYCAAHPDRALRMLFAAPA